MRKFSTPIRLFVAAGVLIAGLITLFFPTSHPANSQMGTPQHIESDDARVQRAGNWTVQTATDASGGAYLYNSGAEADVLTLEFIGPSVSVIYVTGPNLGTLAIEVDDTVLRTVITAAETTAFNQQANINYLTDEPHTLRVYAQAGGIVAIDAFIIGLPAEVDAPVVSAPNAPCPVPPSNRISVAADGTQANGGSVNPSISADGRYVVFTSDASNLVPNDTNALSDIFVVDRQNCDVRRVSVSSAGEQANGHSVGSAISSGGRFVVFNTSATNLFPNDTNGLWDLVVHDLQTGQTNRVNVNTVSAQDANGFVRQMAVSDDGRYVAFISLSNTVVTPDRNAEQDVFLHDRQTDQTRLVSVTSAGAQANGPSYWPSISADGRYMVYASHGTNLVPNDTDTIIWAGSGQNYRDIFLYDRETAQTTRLSVNASGVQGDGDSFYPMISGDGQIVVFQSNATNLGAEAAPEMLNVYRLDRATGQFTRLPPVLGDDNQHNPAVYTPAVDTAVFVSTNSTLVEGDTNNAPDIFAQPLILNVAPLSRTQMRLTWQDIWADETAVHIERSANGQSGWVEIGTTPANQTTYDDNSLTCQTYYYYRVRAAVTSGFSIYSNVASNQTITCPPAPPVMSNPTYSGGQVNLNWSSSNNVNRYDIEVSNDGNTWQFLASDEVTPPLYFPGYSYAVPQPNDCTDQYYYRMRSYRASSNEYSIYSNVVWWGEPCVIPAAPSNLEITNQTAVQITLVWSDNSNNEVEFRIQRSTSGTNWSNYASTVANQTTRNISIAGLSCGTTYYYRVRAFAGFSYINNDYVYSDPSNVVIYTYTTNCPVQAPSNLQVTNITSSQVALTWQDNATTETGFEVYISPLNTSSWSLLATVNANETTYINSNIYWSCDRILYYRVRATSSIGPSAYSNIVNATYATTCPPIAPTNLQITALTGNQIDLAWTDNSENETNFRVSRSTNNVNWTQITTTVPINATTYTHTNQTWTCGTTYYYRVAAFSSTQISAYSNVVTFTSTYNCTPISPTNLQITATSATQVDLVWTDNSTNEDGFRIQRSTNNTSWSQVGSVGTNQTSFAHINLTWVCGETYYYRVLAYSGTASSAYTNTVYAISTFNCPATAPTNLQIASVSYAAVGLTWTDNSENETSFRLYRSPSGIDDWTFLGSVSANATTYTHNNPSWVCGLTYYYRVAAFVGAASSAYSNSATLVSTYNCTPIAPTNLVATLVTANQNDLAWTDNADNEDSFRIYRSTNGTTWSQVGTVGANVTTFAHTNLTWTCGATHYYRVRAYSGTAFSSYTNVVTVTLTVCTPTAPTNLQITSSNSTQVNLAWTDNASDETGYVVHTATSSAFTSPIVNNLPANTTTFVATPPVCGTTHYYRVAASNGNGNSPFSNVVNVVGGVCAPTAPSNLVVTALSPSLIRLTWQDNSNNEANFGIENSVNAQNFSVLGSVPANTTTYLDTELQCGATYYYRVRAMSASGPHSSYTTMVSATAPLCVPADTLAIFTGNTARLSISTASPLNTSHYITLNLNPPAAGQWVMGDWNGDNLETPGVYANGAFHYTNDLSANATWTGIWIGLTGRPVVAGRFSSAAANDCIGVIDNANFPPYGTAFALYFTCNLTNGPSPALTFQWLSVLLPDSQGHTGDWQFAAGDFNNDGVDSIAVRRGQYIAFTDTPPTTQNSMFDRAQFFGSPLPSYGLFVAGDWDNNNLDSFGIVYISGQVYRKNDLDWNSGQYQIQALGQTLTNPMNVVSWRWR